MHGSDAQLATGSAGRKTRAGAPHLAAVAPPAGASLSLIMPVRDWAPERIAASTRSFLELAATSIDEVIIVDFGSKTPVELPDHADPRLKLLRLEANVWSLAEAINAGVLVARNEILAKTDADILAGPQSASEFDRLAQRVAAGEIGLAITQATDLHQSLSVSEALAQVLGGREPLGRLRAKWGQGGLVFFSKAVWNRVGGFDSRFTGWGNEDNDFAERVRRLGLRLSWADRDALKIYHVWHPPTYAATGVLTQRQSNQKIAQSDRSVLRSVAFRHSNFEKVAPAIKAASPLVTLGVATTGRPNRNRMILEAIGSFRGQIDQDYEILVVDNGSSDDDFERLQSALGKARWVRRLRIERQTEASIPAARNLISRLAEGRYICVVDDDDLALPNRLADHLKIFEGDGTRHGSHGGWIDFDESTGVIERNSGKLRATPTLLKGTGKITAHPASFYRTDVMRAVPYDEAFAFGSDLDLALRMANLGFEIAHTNSYLTLRRYHSSNVTITGQSNQVSNGNTARTRALATFGWNKLPALEERAKSNDAELYCRNQLSIETLAERIPGYSGLWQIYVPLAAVAAPGSSAEALPGTEVPQATLESLLNIIGVDLCTKRSGLNQPIFFRSTRVAGLHKARRIKAEIEAMIRVPVHLSAVRQGQLDRETPFQWKLIEIKTGERVLRSEAHAELSDVMGVLAELGPKSLLARSLSILSDFVNGAESYCLVSRAIKGHEEVRAMRFELERMTKIRFHAVTGNGVVSELTPGRTQ